MQVYLDHHATTPVDGEVLAEMLPFFSTHFGNASSSHSWGQEAALAVETARAQVAELIGAHPLEILFTSGATEAVNLALKGLAQESSRRHIITWQTEHPAVLDCCDHLAQQGFRITYLELQPDGHLDLTALAAALDNDTLAVSLMWANNEIGTVHDVAAVSALARQYGAFFHCDASQALGRVDVDVEHVDLLSLSAHKIYGPKGVGALYMRRKSPRVRLSAQTHGGGHERGMRSGTLNVPAIVGLGKACALAADQLASEPLRLAALRDSLLLQLEPVGPIVAGDMSRRLSGNLNLRFDGVKAADLLACLPNIALSTSSACSQVARTPSRTLQALGLTGAQVAGHVRVGIGRFNTQAEIDHVALAMIAVVKKCRSQAPSETVCEL